MNARHSAARSRTTWPLSRVLSAGSPMMRRASARAPRLAVLGLEPVHPLQQDPGQRGGGPRRRDPARPSGCGPATRRRRGGPSAPRRTRRFRVRRRRTGRGSAGTRSTGSAPRPPRPRRASPRRRTARRARRETPGGGSWRRPQVRGRALRKSTRETRRGWFVIPSVGILRRTAPQDDRYCRSRAATARVIPAASCSGTPRSASSSRASRSAAPSPRPSRAGSAPCGAPTRG